MSNKSYTPSSAAYPGSSPYALPSQPPFNNSLSRQSSQWRNNPSQLSPPLSPARTYSSTRSSRTERSPPSYNAATSRKPSLFSLRNSTSRSSTSSADSNSTSDSSLESPIEVGPSSSSRHSSIASNASFSASIKSFFSRSETPEQRAVRKADKARRKRIERAEQAAYQRAQEMEASALYMAWRYGEGNNTVSYCMF